MITSCRNILPNHSFRQFQFQGSWFTLQHLTLLEPYHLTSHTPHPFKTSWLPALVSRETDCDWQAWGPRPIWRRPLIFKVNQKPLVCVHGVGCMCLRCWPVSPTMNWKVNECKVWRVKKAVTGTENQTAGVPDPESRAKMPHVWLWEQWCGRQVNLRHC